MFEQIFPIVWNHWIRDEIMIRKEIFHQKLSSVLHKKLLHSQYFKLYEIIYGNASQPIDTEMEDLFSHFLLLERYLFDHGF